MIDRNLRVVALGALLVAFGLAIVAGPVAQAGHSNVTQQDWQKIFHNVVVAPSAVIKAGPSVPGTFTFKALEKSENQAVQIQGTGTSPNYKVELLCSIDNVTFTKPEIGGDIGTFTDANVHFCPLYGPVSLYHALQITELGGANSVTIEASEGSQ